MAQHKHWRKWKSTTTHRQVQAGCSKLFFIHLKTYLFLLEGKFQNLAEGLAQTVFEHFLRRLAKHLTTCILALKYSKRRIRQCSFPAPHPIWQLSIWETPSSLSETPTTDLFEDQPGSMHFVYICLYSSNYVLIAMEHPLVWVLLWKLKFIRRCQRVSQHRCAALLFDPRTCKRKYGCDHWISWACFNLLQVVLNIWYGKTKSFREQNNTCFLCSGIQTKN